MTIYNVININGLISVSNDLLIELFLLQQCDDSHATKTMNQAIFDDLIKLKAVRLWSHHSILIASDYMHTTYSHPCCVSVCACMSRCSTQMSPFRIETQEYRVK